MNLRYPYIISVDFETFYDPADNYSLQRKEMTAEMYINDPRFEVILCTVIVNGKKHWMDARDPYAFAEWLKSFPWDQSITIAHNGCFFDFLILGWKYGIVPAFYMDTLLMARPLAGPKESSSLKNLAKRLGLGEKGDEIERTAGMRLQDFSEEQLIRYAEYGMQDSWLCLQIALRLVRYWTPKSLAWMSIACRMGAFPQFELDHDVIEEGLALEETNAKNRLQMLATQLRAQGWRPPLIEKGKLKGKPYTLEECIKKDSLFCDMLEALGSEVPEKYSEKQRKMVPAFAKTDPMMRQALEGGHADGTLQAALEARLGVKSTAMASRLIRHKGISERMQMLPISIQPFGAHTGRNAGAQKLNPQNYGSRPSPSNPLGKKNAARRSMKMRKGYTLVAADERQVEVRVLAAVCGDEALLERYAADPDYSPYLDFGSELYQRPISKKEDAIEYNSSKEAILACGFGLGDAGYLNRCKQNGIPMTAAKSKEIVYFYRDGHPEVTDFWAQCTWALNQIMDGRNGTFGYRGCLRVYDEAIIFPSGRPLRYKDLHWTKRPSRDDPDEMEDALVFYDPIKHFHRKVYGSLVTENIVQGVAADIVQEAGVALAFKNNLWPILQVHDELAFAIRDEEVQQMLPVIAREMRRSPDWLSWIPLDCEVDVGQDYGVMEEVRV